MIKTIQGAMLRKMFLGGAKLLEINKQNVDALNVFPVPDGDTGTNMSLTVMSAVREINSCQSNNIPDIVDALSRGALKGARGNSGVILSQIFKGMSSVLFKCSEEITVKNFSKALAEGANIAYKAVTKPKEGTILTVIRVVSEHALTVAKRTNDFQKFFEEILAKGDEILAQTPEMLPVLKKAGVVDAGGKGLLIIINGFMRAMLDLDLGAEVSDSEQPESSTVEMDAELEYFDVEDIKFAYCTEFFVINLFKMTTEADIGRLKEQLMAIGDSVICIGDLTMVKVHVHTNEPNLALGYALKLGELNGIKIENMLEQNRALVAQREASKKQFGMVAVCAGEGLTAIFKDLQVDYVVTGGQSMNPSADDIAYACKRVNAEHIFIFPNNKNIILAAEQAKSLTEKRLHVIPTKNIPQGFAAALAFNPDATYEENISNMNNAIENIICGQITYSVRDVKLNGFNLKEGDIIAVDNKNVIAQGTNPNDVAEQLVDKLVNNHISMISLYYGYTVTEEEAEELKNKLAEKYPNFEVEAWEGGQPLYHYLISLE